jgi:diguanylate cyclase (GGDEF)-like protein/PAS domain S-box-containing protein
MDNPSRLLVVDDDPYNRDVLSRRLARRGYDVVVAADGAEALSLIEEQTFDLVLLDQMMPGISGMDLLRLLRGSFSDAELPVIMVTAQSESENIVQALQSGANDYVVKPVDFPVAAARIQAQLSRKAANDALRQSEERYSLAARGSKDGLWDWDLKRGTVFYSERWKAMLGFSPGELTSSPEEWFSRICEIDRDTVRSAVRHHLGNGASEFMAEYRMMHRDGGIRWMRSRAISSRDAAGRVVRLTGSQSDVTAPMTTDPLTGLRNRVHLIDEIERTLAANSGDSRFALLVLDLDGFKLVNDSLGHLRGDLLLKGVAVRLRRACSEQALGNSGSRPEIARLGGDEFAVLLRDQTGQEPAELAARFIRDLGTPFTIDGHDVFTGVSIGIASADGAYRSADEVLRDADTAMYRAKTRGRGRYEFFDASMRARTVARMENETGLRRALDRGELAVFYQPKVELRAGSLIGFEALARWRHPQRGLISPNEFIPVAEETGLIIPIGMWALAEGCRQMRRWEDQETLARNLTLSVNLSPRQFADPHLCESITAVLDETGYRAGNVCLEITENVLADDLEGACQTLNRLAELGISLKLDDFGTGYSSLNYLSRLPFDTLKIDRSFVSRMAESQETSGIVKTIIGLAGDLHMDVIAEGVETREQLVRLRDLGCQYGQGFYFGRPEPPATVGERLIGRLRQSDVLPSLNDGH